MDRFRILRKLSALELFSIGVFVLATLIISVIIQSGSNIYAYMEITDSWTNTIIFTLNLILNLTDIFGTLSAVLIILLGVLLGLNVVLLIEHTVIQRSLTKHKPSFSAVHSVVGAIATMLGIGCAACGSAILFSILSIFGATGILLVLPLHGNEIAIIGLIILSLNTWFLLGKLNRPFICDI